jgi:hypothetical protein
MKWSPEVSKGYIWNAFNASNEPKLYTIWVNWSGMVRRVRGTPWWTCCCNSEKNVNLCFDWELKCLQQLYTTRENIAIWEHHLTVEANPLSLAGLNIYSSWLSLYRIYLYRIIDAPLWTIVSQMKKISSSQGQLCGVR